MNRPLSFSDTFDGILELVDQLRSEEGCPWDQEQTLQTLSPLVLEECYELVEAIEIESDSGRLEELGDLFYTWLSRFLFQKRKVHLRDQMYLHQL